MSNDVLAEAPGGMAPCARCASAGRTVALHLVMARRVRGSARIVGIALFGLAVMLPVLGAVFPDVHERG